MDYSPIKKLKLKEAFADHSKFRTVRCDEDYLAELFEWSDNPGYYLIGGVLFGIIIMDL